MQQQTPSIVVQEDDFFVSANPSSNQNTSEATYTPSSSATSNLVSSPSPPSKKTKSLNEIYGYTNFALMSQIEAEPRCFEDAVKELIWFKAMDKEMAAIKKNETWALADPPTQKEVIGVKWFYKTKYATDGSIQRHKARLVAKGYAQQPSIDYNETYTLVARFDTIRTVLALAAQYKWLVYQFDVKSAFLNGELKEDVYVHQPQGYEEARNEHKVYKLKKALYGLKQAPRAWYSRIDTYFLKKGFNRSENEHTLYIKSNGNDIIIVCLYVDDLIYTSSSDLLVEEFRQAMMTEFEMTDLGLLHYFLGIEVTQMNDGIFISQEKYVSNLLDKWKMGNCKPMSTPMNTNEKFYVEDGVEKVDAQSYRSLVGSPLYLTTIRPNIMHAVGLISRFMQSPSKMHFGAAKRILRYLSGTRNYGIWYTSSSNFGLVGYTDSDWAGSIDDRKSTLGYVFSLGSGAVLWCSKKQPIISLSSTEAEYIAADIFTKSLPKGKFQYMRDMLGITLLSIKGEC